ncbi:MAG: hypothetical protein KC466_13610 [Myxococcales bacterium]|nr:hypothetical protein [Myxococcales bacterium]
MDPAFAAVEAVLRRSAEASGDAKERHLKATEARRGRDLARIVAARDAALGRALRPAEGGGSAAMKALAEGVLAYARRNDWNWIDVLLLLACLDEDAGVCERLGRAGLLYQSYRMVDDVLDGHRDYKGHYPTLLGELERAGRSPSEVSALTLLPALAMMCEALDGSAPMEAFAALARRTVLGALTECMPSEDLTLDRYEAIVEGKMVCYGLLLYGPAIEAAAPPEREALGGFLESSFFVAQVANDLVDREDDRRRGQPNFWNLQSDRAAARRFVERVEDLGRRADGLADRLRPYGRSRVHDIANYALGPLTKS